MTYSDLQLQLHPLPVSLGTNTFLNLQDKTKSPPLTAALGNDILGLDETPPAPFDRQEN